MTALAADRFEPWSAQHVVLLVLFLVGAVGIVLLGRRQRGTDAARRFSRGMAVAITCVTIPSQVFQLTPGDFELGSSLPVNLCDVAWLTAVWGLWTHKPLPVALTYYWGLVLTSQGILTPSLGQEFPHPRFFAFWAMHFLIVWAALYLTVGLGIAPTWRLYRITVALTLVWAVLTYVFDVAADVNYGYLVEKPGSGSLLDPLGPWPVYLLAATAVLLGVWALMTWPWVRRGGRAGAGFASGGGGRFPSGGGGRFPR